MASPQRRFPVEANPPPAPQPQLQQRPPAPRTSRATRRWRYGYSWILLALFLGLWYVGFGWGNSGGWIWGNRSTSIAANRAFSGSGLVILEVANKQDYVGQSFQIENVAVDHWSGNRAVWIGSRHSYLPMLLILPSASALAPKTAGQENSGTPAAGASEESDPAQGAKVQHLDVTGRVMKAPPTAEAQKRWGLSDEDVDQLEEEAVYIQATSVQPAKH